MEDCSGEQVDDLIYSWAHLGQSCLSKGCAFFPSPPPTAKHLGSCSLVFVMYYQLDLVDCSPGPISLNLSTFPY